MKKVLYILSLVITASLASCDDFLDTPSKSSLDESVIFAYPEYAEGAVMGIYLSFAETNSYRGRFLPWYGLNTDIEFYHSSAVTLDRGVNNKSDLVTYFQLPSNSEMNTDNNAWAKMYEGIERANICIRGLRTYGNPLPGTQMGYLLGEALTVRAVYYADLVRAWGDVVARFEPISTDLYIPKSDRDVIYKQLIADLGEAEKLVYWPNEADVTKTVERVNKVFVKALRARLCMNASGYSQRPDGIRLSNDPELQRSVLYPIAYKECKDILDKGYVLDASFENIFKKVCQDNVTAGAESLWEIPFSAGRGRMLYSFAVKHNAKDQYTQQNAGGAAGPLPNVFYDYDVNDLRRDVTCVPYVWSDNAVAKQELSTVNKWYFGKFRYEWMNRIVTSSNDDGVNKQYMRMAEVYLIAAECALHIEGPDAAIPYLKAIRQRAFPSNLWGEKVDSYLESRKADMLNVIIDENALEFCGEMVRKESLIRWNLLKTKMDQAKEKMVALRSRSGAYADLPENLYYKYATDKVSLVVYGLNHGDSDATYAGNPELTSLSWLGETKISDDKVNSLYNANPDNYQFWPIWQNFLDTSNGMLKNDYGY